MTFENLGQNYLIRAKKRRVALVALMEVEDWADVVREAQELVELVLKGLLRIAGIDPPHHHDVGPFIIEFSSRLGLSPEEAAKTAAISMRLRKEREQAFYGDIDMIPSDIYKKEDGERALADADYILALIR